MKRIGIDSPAATRCLQHGCQANSGLFDAVEAFIRAYKPLRRNGLSDWHYCDVCLSREDQGHSPGCEYSKLRNALIAEMKKRDPLPESESA